MRKKTVSDTYGRRKAVTVDIGDTDTVEEMVAALVAAINVVIQDGEEDVRAIELTHVIEELYRRREEADTSVTLTTFMVSRAADVLIEYTRETYGLFAPLRIGEINLDKIGNAMINIAIADMGMRITPIEFLRMVIIQERLTDFVVVFALACLDSDMQRPHDEELGTPVDEEADQAGGWMAQAGVILADRELLEIYTTAIWDYEGLPGFERALQRMVASMKGEIGAAGLYWAIDEASLQCELAPHIMGVYAILRFGDKRPPRGEA